jgi:hypothetical protein
LQGKGGAWKAQQSLVQTAGDLENAGYSPSFLQGKGGAWKAQQSLVQTAGDLENAGYSPSFLQGPGGAWKAQQSLVKTAGYLENAGYDPSFLQGNGGAWKAQQSLVQAADNYSAAGVPLSMLRGNGGSKVASDIFLVTRQRLHDNGLPESLIASNAGRAAKAQSTIVATALELRVMGFSDKEISILLRGNHASFTCQQKLLVAVECLQSETQVKNKTIVKLLCESNKSNAKVLQGLGEIAVKLLATGIGEDVLVARLGRYAADDPSGRLAYLCE